MTSLLEATLRVSTVLGAALVIVELIPRRSAAARHALVAGALLCSAVAVAASRFLPGWHVPLEWTTAQAVVSAPRGGVVHVLADVVESTAADRGLVPFDALLLLIWAAGVAVSVAVLIAALVRLRHVSRSAQKVTAGPWRWTADALARELGIRRPVVLLQTDLSGFLATWGMQRPRIGLPRGAADWPEARVRAVLHHELAHIRRRDWMVQLVAEFVCAAQWFNPLCWIASRRLRQLSEMACDDAALRCGMPADEYATHLLEITRSCRPLSAPLVVVPMARESTFERRIVAMLNRSADRRPVTRGDLVGMTVLLLVLAAPASMLHARQAGPLPFTGSIYDASGALLPEASVSLTDSQQHEQKTATDASGRFTIPSVPAGKYVLRVMLAGFAPLMQDVELAGAGDWARVVTLQVGEVQEEVLVETGRIGAKPTVAPAGPPLKVGGNIRPPRKITHVNPVYPQSMKDAGIEGAVPLEAVIAGDGSVQTVRVLTAGVHPDLAIAAVDAVRQWKFEPTLLNGKPVPIKMKVTIEFRLKD
jgi:TonB family protein